MFLPPAGIENLRPPTVRATVARVRASPLGSRLAHGAFWSLASAVIARAFALVTSVLVARMLGRAGFGELGMIQATVGVFGDLAGAGLGLTVTKHVAELRARDPEKAGRILALSSAVAWVAGATLALVLLLLAPWLAATTLDAPHLGLPLQVSALLLLPSAVSGAQTGALSGLEAFRTIARVNAAAGVLALPLVVTGAWLWRLEGAIWGLVGAQALSCALMHFGLRRAASRAGVPLNPPGWLREWPVLGSFALPAALSGALVGPVNWVCAAMLVHQPNGYGEMGVFSAANQWRTAFLFVPTALTDAAVPMMSERAGALGRAGPRPVLRHLFRLNAALGVPTLIALCAFSPLIMAAYGPAFGDAWPVLVILLAAAFLQLMQAPLMKLWVATGRMWMNFTVNILWASTVLAASYLLISQKAAGLALGQLAGFVVYGLLLVGLSQWRWRSG